MSQHAIILFTLCLSITSIVSADETCSNIPMKDRTQQERLFHSCYEDLNTNKTQQFYYKDPFIWTLSQEFADKFAMPQEWVDPALKGALALAWRTTNIGQTMCGHGGNPNACWPAFTCQLDVYVDNKAPIPWHTADTQDFDWRGLSSYSYLPYRWPESRQTKNLEEPVESRPKPVYALRHDGSYVNVGDLVFFDRQFAPGISLLSFKDACPSMSKYLKEQTSRIGFVSRQALKESRGDPKTYAHNIELPFAFVHKIAKKHEEDKEIANQANTAYKQIMQRYAPNAGVSATHGVNND